jgi:hypothetical protein
VDLVRITHMSRYSVCLLYWYTSTNTDAEGPSAHHTCLGTQFTCFTGTKVQIMTQKDLVRITHMSRYSVYLLYWYKSTNTDAEGAGSMLY